MADLTIDQELDLLEDAFRRLKVEYDIYFAGGAKRPPIDNESRLRAQIRRYMENSRLNQAQRYRITNAAQRYSVFTDLWRRKNRVKDEGYRHPEDKILGVGGFGHLESLQPQSHPPPVAMPPESIVLCTGDSSELFALYEAVIRAREAAGQPLGAFDSFAAFVRRKTESIREQFKCQAVEYTVSVQGGQVSLKARPAKSA